MEPLDTLVVGAGVSGLACAHARMRAGASVRVLEASERAGGLVRTTTAEGFRFEEGPEALPPNAREVRGLCAELGVPLHDAPPDAAKRYLWSDGKLLEVPASLEDMATSRLLSFGAKLRLLAEATCARDKALDGSIADFARHRFGAEALERIVEPLVVGILAGDPETLSLRACFPDVVRMVEEHGSVTAALKARAQAKPRPAFGGAPPPRKSPLFRPADGMEALCRALAAALGARFSARTPVRALERASDGWCALDAGGERHVARHLVLAVPMHAARALLAPVAPEGAAALAPMQAEGLVSVAHAYRRTDVSHALDGAGYLVPRTAGGLVLGTLFSSTIDPACAPAGHVLLRSLLGGARRTDALALADDELVARTHAECSGPLGLARTPVFARVARWPGAIPRLDLEHPARLTAFERALPPGLVVLGSFVRGAAVETLVAGARAAAGTLS